MEVQDFFRISNKICSTQAECKNCPFDSLPFDCYDFQAYGKHLEYLGKLVQILTEYEEKNPTKQALFLKNFPKAQLDEHGYIDICPQLLEKDLECPYKNPFDNELFFTCEDCHKKYWEEQQMKIIVEICERKQVEIEVNNKFLPLEDWAKKHSEDSWFSQMQDELIETVKTKLNTPVRWEEEDVETAIETIYTSDMWPIAEY